MRLNCIKAEPGTIIGVDYRSGRFLTVESIDSELPFYRVNLRYSTAEEVTPESFKHEPRSIVEHRAIPRRLTPFGMARVFKPTPYPFTDGTDPLIGRYSGKPLGIL